MKAYLLYLWDTVRGSYWLAPSLCLAAAAALSLIVPEADEAIVAAGWEGPEWIYTSTATARTTIAATAGAMIAATGTVFSVTIVTLSLTSQQFGPRLLRRFMSDLITQFTLGIFLGTGFYCLFVLRSVKTYPEEASALHLSALIAVLLAVISMIMLIAFINHVTKVIQAPHIVASVGEDLDDAIVRLFPESVGEAAEVEQEQPKEIEAPRDAIEVQATVEGYVQAISTESVMELASENGLVVRMRIRPGELVVRSMPLAQVWRSDREGSWPLNESKLEEELNSKVITGIRRTPRQDAGCAINELAEVAVRSLSPGINDPFTAMNCIDRLGASMSRLAQRAMPSPFRRDDAGEFRFVARPESFPELLDGAFDQIRRHAAGDVAVTRRLLEALALIASRAKRRDDREAVRGHAELAMRSAEGVAEERDRQEIEKAFEEVVAALEGSS